MKGVFSRKERSLTGKLLRMLRMDRVPDIFSGTSGGVDRHVNSRPSFIKWESMEVARMEAEHNVALAYSYTDQKERFNFLR